MLSASLLPAAGSSGFSFLKIGVDSRAAAMGNAASALVTDASASFWNPAGISMADGDNLVLMHNDWIEDISHEFAAVQLLSGEHNLAVSLNMIFIPGVEVRGVVPTEEPIGESDASNLALGFSYAREVMPGLHAGIQLKYLYEKYYLHSADGYAIDLGVVKKDLFAGIDAAVTLQNLGFMHKLVNEATKLPVLLRAGLAAPLQPSVIPGELRLAADFTADFDETTQFGVGVEYQPASYLAVRAGYLAGSDVQDLTAGLGIIFSAMEVAYAWVPFSYDLGSGHRFTFKFGF